MTPSLKKFYHLFWQDPVCRGVFLTHKDQLLEKNSIDIKLADYYMPRIILSNTRKKKKALIKVSERSDNKFIDIIHRLKQSEEKYLNSDNVLNYFNNNFGQSIHLANVNHPENVVLGMLFEVLEVVQSGGEGIVDFLKKYKAIPDRIKDTNDLAKFVEEEFLKEVSKILKKEEIGDMLMSIDDVSDMYLSTLKNSLINAHKQSVDRLFNNESFKKRVDLFESLYEIGILEGGNYKSYVECTNCLPKTYSGYLSCSIAPSKLNFPCPNCGENSYFLVPYKIDEELYGHLTHADGLLFHAIQFLLENSNVEFDYSVNLLGGNEIDFVIKNKGRIDSLIEVKMYRGDVSEQAMVKNLLGAISQIKKSKDKLISADPSFENTNYFLVSNYQRVEVYESAISKAKKDIEEYKIIILTPEKFASSVG